MKDKVRQAILDYSMISPGDVVVAALSGGADSVCLLHRLKELEDPLQFTLIACHVNHNLRGEASDRDQSFSEELCHSLSVPIEVFSVQVNDTKEKHQSTEERARELRYGVFRDMAEKYGAKVATAHNANDNCETVILNMLRGTGLTGLCGIPPVRDYLIRPLLLTSRREVEEYCKENSLSYVTDATNFSTDYTRNKIRLEILPELLKINPGLLDTVSRMTGNLREDSEYLTSLANGAKNEALVSEGRYDISKLRALPAPIRHRVISLALKEKEIEPSHLRITGIDNIIYAGAGKINIEKHRFAVVKKGILEIQRILQNYRQIHT